MERNIICYILAFSMMTLSCSKDEDIAQTEKEIITEQILELVNDHRESIGKSALIKSAFADELAVEHTNYMIAQNALSHDNFTNRLQKLQQEMNAQTASENVAFSFSTPEAVMEAWLNSPSHKANIEGDFTHIGIAAIKNAQGVYYYTQLFYR